MTGGQIGRASATPASFATPASGIGPHMGQPQGSGFGTYPPRQAIPGHAMSGQIRRASAPSASFATPASGVGPHMGQPQGSGFGTNPPTQASMGQLTGGQIGGPSFFPPSVAVPPSAAHTGQPQGSGFVMYPPGQIGMAQGRARQIRPSGPPASFATPASGGGAQMPQPQGSVLGRSPYMHAIAGHAISGHPVVPPVAGVPPVIAMPPDPPAATPPVPIAPAVLPPTTLPAWPPFAPFPPPAPPTGGFRPDWSLQASPIKPTTKKVTTPADILRIGSSVCSTTAICVPTFAPQLVGRFPRNDVDSDALQTQNSERHRTQRSRQHDGHSSDRPPARLVPKGRLSHLPEPSRFILVVSPALANARVTLLVRAGLCVLLAASSCARKPSPPPPAGPIFAARHARRARRWPRGAAPATVKSSVAARLRRPFTSLRRTSARMGLSTSRSAFSHDCCTAEPVAAPHPAFPHCAPRDRDPTRRAAGLGWLCARESRFTQALAPGAAAST
jgi:hypothetical protein